jgi:ParB-like chromosome segregation protein Spo0J
VTDQRIESVIKQITDSYTFERIDLEDINLAASRTAQNRDGETLDQHHAAQIADAMAAGVKLPPIVVNRARGGYRIIDGNHRVAAMQTRGILTCDAYVLSADDTDETRLCLIFNMFNGKPLTPAAREAHALTLVASGMTLALAAQLCGIAEGTLGDRKRSLEGRRRLEAAQVVRPKGAPAISETSARHLSRLDPDQIKQLGPEVYTARSEHLREVIKTITDAPAAQRLAAAEAGRVALEDARIASRRKPPTKTTPATPDPVGQVARLLTNALTLLKAYPETLQDQRIVDLLGQLTEGTGR